MSEEGNKLIDEGMAAMREILGGREPYSAWVSQYANDPEFRAAVAIQLASVRACKEPLAPYGYKVKLVSREEIKEMYPQKGKK